jgi:hypothetical protein
MIEPLASGVERRHLKCFVSSEAILTDMVKRPRQFFGCVLSAITESPSTGPDEVDHVAQELPRRLRLAVTKQAQLWGQEGHRRHSRRLDAIQIGVGEQF